ncbi:mitochondrial import receptor subunit TOM70-like [Tubulanus polymorphus]|uniref:mitochondrial import receptor subunit TOM70-like n=1 Tax=Tubulanus polymorphus TaxID=672921 RepID=UPI003DA429CE
MKGWQLALAVGAPVALGLAGLWYYKRLKARELGSSGKGSKTDKKAETSSENTPSTPLELAQAAKNKGNKYFKAAQYDKAIECYTQAIDLCPGNNPTDLSTFHQNRAAAYEQLKNYPQVIEDCSKALCYNKKYVKALFRRAKASEHEGHLTMALNDVTAVCILEGFQNQQSLYMADRVLKALGKTKAKEKFKVREPTMPSPHFIRTFFSAFAHDPVMEKVAECERQLKLNDAEKHLNESPEKENQERNSSPFHKAIKAYVQRDYSDIIHLCDEEINTNGANVHEALLFKGTFHLLRGEGNLAMEAFDKIISSDESSLEVKINAYIKRGSLKMQNDLKDEALADFTEAVQVDSQNSDIYHHRGQLNLLLERVDEALRDFEKCVELNPGFAVARVQKCYTEHRYAFMTKNPMLFQTALKSFEEALEEFRDCTEGYALYGQALCDQQMYELSEKNFQKAIELDPENANIYVHRGLLQLQWKQDVDEAMKLLKKAIELDDLCELAYETLGTIEVQRGCLDRAHELFNKAINLAKTEQDMAHLYSLLAAAQAQSKAAHDLGLQMPGSM